MALSDRSISAGTSKVYAKVLESLVRDIRGCQDKTESVDEDDAEPDLISLPYISTDELVAATEDFSDLSSALGKVDDGRVDMRRFDHRKKRRKKEVISEDEAMVDGDANPNKDEDESSSNGDDNISDIASSSAEVDYEAEYNHGPTIIQDPHRATIREHLFVLSMHPYKFLHYLPGTTFHPERWTVDFPTLSKNVIHDTLLQTITSRHGLSAARLVRLLHEKGKVDEKQLCSLSLLAQKTMRSALLPMHKAGMIGLQEVPRDSSRNPQRTNFLWFFDAERCKVKLLEETYKAMARCVQRAKVEEEKVKGTVEKASRSDVIGREEDFLGVQEMEALRRWRETEEVIGGEVGRLDDLVSILRDF